MGPGPSAPASRLEGTLERVMYQHGESHFTVARLRVEGRSQPVTIVGSLAGIAPGSTLRMSGRWEHDRKFGEQFRVESFQPVTPATVDGIERFLGSGLVPGIGAELARRIVETFGASTLEIIAGQPERLVEVEGIGAVRAARIREGLEAQREVQEVMVFLQGHGVSPAYAARIYKRYGAATIGLVRENPYRLALEVWGIGFRTADAIARKLGIAADSPARAEAGVLHVLGELVDEGHCHAPEPELARAAGRTLEIDEPTILRAIEVLLGARRVVREPLGDRGPCVSLRALFEAERAAAEGVLRLSAAPARPVAVDVERALAWAEREAGLTLALRQRDAVRAAIAEKVVVITGGPGVGKTTVVNTILRILEAKRRRVLLAAPTGRAAKRLTETTGRPAQTLHRLLEFNPRDGAFARAAGNPLEADVVVCDEASMVDVPLFAALVAAVPSPAQLVLVGDVDQLPSVGPGRVLADVLAARRPLGPPVAADGRPHDPAPNVVTVVRLTEIYRQSAQSRIVTNAHRVNRGELPEPSTTDGGDFFFVERDDPAEALRTVCDIVAERLPRRFGLDATGDVQVLTPMHRGEVGAQNLNAALQARLNPPGEGKRELVRGARVFRVGDKVIQLKNDYDREVWNGDVGRVAGVDEGASGPTLHVTIDGRDVFYEANELDQLAHAFALSVHKSQGSEYPAVVVPLVTQHFLLLQRNLLYTAITRGKKVVVLVGSRKALGIAVRTDDTRLRWTWLRRRIETDDVPPP